MQRDEVWFGQAPSRSKPKKNNIIPKRIFRLLKYSLNKLFRLAVSINELLTKEVWRGFSKSF